MYTYMYVVHVTLKAALPYTCIYIYTHIHIYVYICVYMYIHTYTVLYIERCIHYIHIHIYICTYIYIYIYSGARNLWTSQKWY